MTRLKPFKYDVYCHFKCINCGAEIVQSFQEVKLIGKYVCVGCNTLMEFEKMGEIVVSPKYIRDKSKLVISRPIMAKPINEKATIPYRVSTAKQFDEKTNEVVKGLMKLGFYKSVAQDAVNRVIDSGKKYSNENELFEACFNEASSKG